MMDNKIVVKHSSIVINNYELGDHPTLEGFFKLFDRVRHEEYYKGIEYIAEEKKLILPRGLDIYYLESIFKCKAVVDYNHDPYDKLDNIMIKYKPRDSVQKEALAFMIGIREYKANSAKSQLSVNLNTGKGKSYCSISTAAYLGIRSIVITSSINWLNQWKDYILEYTDIQPREILMLTGTPTVLRLLNKDISQYKFILASHATIRSYGDTYGWDKVTELFKYMRCGLKFYDEAHLSFDNMCKIDFYTNSWKTFYITATPARSDTDENRIYQLYLKNIPSIDLFDENEDPHTEYIAVKYNSKPSPKDISDCKNKYGLDRNTYTKYIANKENFFKAFRILINLFAKCKEGKCLIYVGTIDAINIISDWMKKEFPEYHDNIGIYTAKVTENKEAQLEKKIIFSTTKSCGAAMDIKDLKMTIVLAEPFKSEVLARQTLGRTRNDNTYYIELVDTGFYQINKYYNYKKPIFEKYASNCSEMSIGANELDIRCEKILKERKIKYCPIRIIENEDLYHPSYKGNDYLSKCPILYLKE